MHAEEKQNPVRKILIITNSDSGLYDFRKELLLELVKDGLEVIVSVPVGHYQDRIEAIGCKVIPAVFDRRGMNPLKDLKLLSTYLRIVKDIQPDVVLTYTVKPNIYGGIACRFNKTPYMVNITGLGTAIENPGMLKTLLLFLYKLSLKKAACVLFQNEYNKEFMEQHGCRSKINLLLPGSGVNLEEHPYRNYPTEFEEIRLLSVMRIMKDKGIEELLACIPKIHKKFPNVVFTIAGAYEEETRQQYEPLINNLQEKGVLRYYGYREDLNQIMADSHMIVHPSYHEGMSNVLLEAAATGRPVVATDIRGCIETFIPGVSGESCKSKDSDSLQVALEKILSLTPEQRQQMGINGRRHVEEHFDRKQVVTIYRNEIRRITDEFI